MNEGAGTAVDALAGLQGRVRQLVYAVVAAAYPGFVSRDEAAALARINRSLAAFHLDRLAEAGLLEVTHRRLSGRTGPGAGRPSKLYRRSRASVEVSIPRRDYALAGELLVEALQTLDSGEAIRQAGRRFGSELGAEARRKAGPGADQPALIRELRAALAAHGYEPAELEGQVIRLCNCPFDELATRHADSICQLNLAVIGAATESAGVAETLRAEAMPEPGFCCVALKRLDP